MSLLLALLAVAAYFALPADWRQATSRAGNQWLNLCDQSLSKLSEGVRLALTLLIPMVALAVCT